MENTIRNIITEAMQQDSDNEFSWNIAAEKIIQQAQKNNSKPKAEKFFRSLIKWAKNIPMKAKVKIFAAVIGILIFSIGASNIQEIIPADEPEIAQIAHRIEKNLNLDQTIEKKFAPKFEAPASTSDSLRNFLKIEEGAIGGKGLPMLKAYNIGDGMITIGWGHAERVSRTNRKVGDAISVEEAEAFLTEDIKEAEGVLNRILKKWKNENIEFQIDQPMYDAMVSMIFNMGGGNFRKTKFIQLVKQGKYREAAERIKVTMVSYSGHVKRRAKESAMFATNIPAGPSGDEIAVKEIQAIIRESVYRLI